MEVLQNVLTSEVSMQRTFSFSSAGWTERSYRKGLEEERRGDGEIALNNSN
jgi:hypothetical protein